MDRAMRRNSLFTCAPLFCRAATARLLAVAMLLLMLGGCGGQVNPATGREEFTPLLPPAAESEIGAREHRKILKRYGLYDKTRPGAYAAAIVARIGAQTETAKRDKGFRYTLTILDSPEINAFALPGGYVYVTRGLMALAGDEAELASVLAHEIGHVVARHAANRINRAMGINLGVAILGAVTGNNQIARLGDLGGQLYLSAYSREQELEADALGIRYLIRAGYDPYAAARFLGRLEKHEQFLKAQGKRRGGNSLFASHPPTPERILEARRLANLAGKTGIRRRDAHLDAIDGMLFGDSGRDGFLRDGIFYHPAIGFSFPVPPGFTLDNNEDFILLTKGRITVIFDEEQNRKLARRRMGMTHYILDYWGRGFKPQNVQAISINGLPAATALTRVRRGGRSYDLRLVAIRFSSGRIFRFQILLPERIGTTDLTALKRMTYRFRRLGPDDPVPVARHIRIHRIAAGETRRGLIARMRLPAKIRAGWFDLLNGDVAIRPGNRIKLVR